MQYLNLTTQFHNTYFIMYAQNPKELNETNRNQIALTQKEICTIIQMGVCYVDKTCFLRPGHIYLLVKEECLSYKNKSIISW